MFGKKDSSSLIINIYGYSKDGREVLLQREFLPIKSEGGFCLPEDTAYIEIAELQGFYDIAQGLAGNSSLIKRLPLQEDLIRLQVANSDNCVPKNDCCFLTGTPLRVYIGQKIKMSAEMAVMAGSKHFTSQNDEMCENDPIQYRKSCADYGFCYIIAPNGKKVLQSILREDDKVVPDLATLEQLIKDISKEYAAIEQSTETIKKLAFGLNAEGD